MENNENNWSRHFCSFWRFLFSEMCLMFFWRKGFLQQQAAAWHILLKSRYFITQNGLDTIFLNSYKNNQQPNTYQ